MAANVAAARSSVLCFLRCQQHFGAQFGLLMQLEKCFEPKSVDGLESYPRCFARGASTSGKTGKAKAKPKTDPKSAKPAKAVKKGGPPAKKETKAADNRDRFNDLLDRCLNAPPPVRAMKEKERVRMLKREALNIFTPEREREIEQEKAAAKALTTNKAKTKGKKSEQGVRDGEEKELEKTALTAEEGKLLAKECSRVMLAEARARSGEEAVRLQLKKDAIAALPENLRVAALVPDLTPFPTSRIPASLSPPIAGYVDEMARAAARASTVKKW